MSSRSSSPPCGVMNLYPRAYTPLTHLAYGGPFLNEIPNAPGCIARFVLEYGRPRCPRGPNALAFYPTDRPMVGVFYQTGHHGPQNGFAVLFVEPGNDPEHVERVVVDRHGPEGITKDTREAAIFLQNGTGVEWIVDEGVHGVGPEIGDKEGELGESVRRWLGRVMDSGLLGEVVDVSSHPTEDHQIARRLRTAGFYHAAKQKKDPPLNTAEFIERPIMFVVRHQPDGRDPRRLLVLVVEEHSPEQVEKEVLARLDLPADGMGIMVAFGRGDEGVQIFR